jgi:hypothetical protein
MYSQIYASYFQVSGSTFVTTLDARNNKISSSEVYTKDLLRPKGCKNIN